MAPATFADAAVLPGVDRPRDGSAGNRLAVVRAAARAVVSMPRQVVAFLAIPPINADRLQQLGQNSGCG